jgi:putative sterol carrier protein
MARYRNLDEVIASYPGRFRADKATDTQATVLMRFTGAGARDVVLLVDNGTLAIRDGDAPADPTLTLTADADDWLDVENGELNPMMALMQQKLKLKGSVPFAMKFMQMFGYGG